MARHSIKLSANGIVKGTKKSTKAIAFRNGQLITVDYEGVETPVGASTSQSFYKTVLDNASEPLNDSGNPVYQIDPVQGGTNVKLLFSGLTGEMADSSIGREITVTTPSAYTLDVVAGTGYKMYLGADSVADEISVTFVGSAPRTWRLTEDGIGGSLGLWIEV